MSEHNGRLSTDGDTAGFLKLLDSVDALERPREFRTGCQKDVVQRLSVGAAC